LLCTGSAGNGERESSEGLSRKLRTYSNVGLLCIDKVGYSSFDDKAADLHYEVVGRCYERMPLIAITNRSFKEWNEVVPIAIGAHRKTGHFRVAGVT
jgi:DNA replication protein DnaC